MKFKNCFNPEQDYGIMLARAKNNYTWGLDLSGTLQGAGGVGGLLSQTIITPTTASSYFPLADAHGNCVSVLPIRKIFVRGYG